MFEDLIIEPMDHDVLMTVAACQDHATNFDDEELVARMQNIDPSIEIETRVETAMGYFFQTGRLDEYRKVMEDAYVLYFAELGYNEKGVICAIRRG